MKVILFLLLIAFPTCTFAAMPVEVLATADDQVGTTLVYKIKERIRESSSLEISLDESIVRMQAQIVTLEQDPRSPGIATVYSVVLTWNNPEQPYPFYLTQYTGYCGALKVDSCADTITAKISEQSDALIRLFLRASQAGT